MWITSSQREIRRAQSNYIQEIISLRLDEKPKSSWQYIESKRTETSGVSPLRGWNGLLYSHTNIQANILHEQFKSTFTTDDTTTMPDKGQSSHPTTPEIKMV